MKPKYKTAATSFRLSPRTITQLDELAEIMQASRGDVLAQAIETMHTSVMQKENEMFGKKTPYEKAERRIDRTPALEPYRVTFLYDWPEGDEHYNWVATAPVAELLDWAQTVEQPE